MGNSASVTIGGGGSRGSGGSSEGGSSSSSGSDGGDSEFDPAGSGSELNAEGGEKSTGLNGGEGGSAGNGNTNHPGSPGVSGTAASRSGIPEGITGRASGGRSFFPDRGSGGSGASGFVDAKIDDETYGGADGQSGTGGIVVIFEYG